MKIDFDVITLRGCLMCFWQYKMERNGGWCWIEDTVVSWTLSQTENDKIKAHTINVLSRRVSLRKNGDYDILMLKIAKDSKSFHHLLFTVITDICWIARRPPKLSRWKQPLRISSRTMPKHWWIVVKRGATVFGTLQNNEVFILFTLITLSSWVASWTPHPFYKSEFDPIFPYSRQSVIFKEMLTSSFLFRKLLFYLENFHCFKKNPTQNKEKENKWVIGECHKGWGFKLFSYPDVWFLFWKYLDLARLELASLLLRHSSCKLFWPCFPLAGLRVCCCALQWVVCL